MKEEWRDIPGFKGRYQVSNKGRVRSLDRYVRCGFEGKGRRFTKGRLLKPGATTSGHLTVALGKGNSVAVHRLVLLAFIGKPKQKQEALHLNHRPADNRVTNLRWGTRSENIAMDWAVGARKHNPNSNRWGYRYG